MEFQLSKQLFAIAIFLLSTQQIATNGANCPTYEWKPFNRLTSRDIVLPTGRDRNSNPLYSCRFRVNGRMTMGKASLVHRACWVPYQGREIGSGGSLTFEVLTANNVAYSRWVQVDASMAFIPGAFLQLEPFFGQYVIQCGWQTGSGYEVTPGEFNFGSSGAVIPFAGGVRSCFKFSMLGIRPECSGQIIPIDPWG